MVLDKQAPLKYIFNKVKTELADVFVFGIFIYYLTIAFDHSIPDIPLTIPTFRGTALSVVLSFKLTQSSDRWWEAGKIWGAL